MSGLILFEDDDLLVVHKPAGLNTHKPDRYAPAGLHEWLTARGRKLSIHQRLDKETSGVILFGKTPRADQSLARQFASHATRKEYLLLSSARPTRKKFRAQTPDAVTEFEYLQPHDQFHLVRAVPVTGKTHQIRRHAAGNGFPIVGDTEYEGAPGPRMMLHAHRLTIRHPATNEPLTFEAGVPRAFDEPDALVAALESRELLLADDTNAWRLINGAADGFPDVIVDHYAGRLLVQWQTGRTAPELLDRLRQVCQPTAIYEQVATKQTRTPPRLVAGTPCTDRFPITENGLTFLINFGEGLSTGLFLDQRENRRRLTSMNLAGKSVLNCFAYTGAFSVAAARAGAQTTTVDLSRNYLAWAKDNFQANALDPAGHEFVAGDVFEWLEKFARRGRTWDVVIIDPPTFSTTKKGRAFQAARDYRELVELALPVVAQGGTLLCSTNQRTLAPQELEATLRATGRVSVALEFATQPFDFRPAAGERPYLKAFWSTLDSPPSPNPRRSTATP